MTYDYLSLNRDSATPLYRQLYDSIKSAVESGLLQKGDRLPPVRKLSEDLSLSCTTVESAYQQLAVEGYLKAEPRRGYFALGAQRPGIPFGTAPASGPPARTEPPVRYDFGTGSVDAEHMDLKIWRRHIRDVLNRQHVIASYGAHQGEPQLREALSAYSFGVRGVHAAPGQIVVGAGTQPLLSLLCGLLSGKEHKVAMEEPGFPQAEQIFSDCGFSVEKLPGDGGGIRMNLLKQSGARLLFVSPSNRVRTGTSIPMSRRFELLRWAEKSGSLLIEDDHNGELRYRARPIPALQGIGDGRNVVYVGSFSKLLLPSVRIGYMVLPPALLELYRKRARNYNQTASKIEQLALAQYLKSGQLERHLRRLRKLYGEKSGRLIRSLKSAFDPKMGILLEETPLSLVLTPDSPESPEELCRVARNHGVRLQPDLERNKIRMGFAGIPLGDIETAVSCLKSAWDGKLRG